MIWTTRDVLFCFFKRGRDASWLLRPATLAVSRHRIVRSWHGRDGWYGASVADGLVRAKQVICLWDPVERARVDPPVSGLSCDKSKAGYFILNLDTQCLHWTMAQPDRAECHHHSNCGWYYLGRRYRRLETFPSDTKWEQVCGNCMPRRKAAMCSNDDFLSDLD